VYFFFRGFSSFFFFLFFSFFFFFFFRCGEWTRLRAVLFPPFLSSRKRRQYFCKRSFNPPPPPPTHCADDLGILQRRGESFPSSLAWRQVYIDNFFFSPPPPLFPLPLCQLDSNKASPSPLPKVWNLSSEGSPLMQL